MRIGALAKQYNISIETIRYYISIRVLSIRIEKKVNYFYEVTTSD